MLQRRLQHLRAHGFDADWLVCCWTAGSSSWLTSLQHPGAHDLGTRSSFLLVVVFGFLVWHEKIERTKLGSIMVQVTGPGGAPYLGLSRTN